MRTIFISAVVEEFEQVHEAVNKFLATKFKKETQQVLFIYNIGPDKVEDNSHNWAGLIHEPKFLILNDAEPLPELVTEIGLTDGKLDFSTARDVAAPTKPYGKDYLRATTDAGIVAQKLIEQLGFDVAFDDFKFYNFFNKPKNIYAAAQKENDLKAIKGFKKD